MGSTSRATGDGKPLTLRDRNALLQRVGDEVEEAGFANPEAATRAVFTVLNQHLDEGEVQHTREMLPKDIRALWPNGVAWRHLSTILQIKKAAGMPVIGRPGR